MIPICPLLFSGSILPCYEGLVSLSMVPTNVADTRTTTTLSTLDNGVHRPANTRKERNL